MSFLHRFRLDLSDVARGVYETLDLRVARHPSESVPFLLTRVLAYAACYRPDLALSPGGLSDTDEPALVARGADGSIALAIEVGQPSARRLHRTSKAARETRVFTYRDPRGLRQELAGERIHGADRILLYALDPKFLERLGARLDRDNSWTIVIHEGTLLVSVGDEALETELSGSPLLGAE